MNVTPNITEKALYNANVRVTKISDNVKILTLIDWSTF